MLLAAFAMKIAAGLVYSAVHQALYNGGDAYKYFKGGKVIHNALWENPWYYLRLVFGKNGGFVETPIYKYAYHTECWDHVGSYAFCRLNALFHLVSGGYYSVHILFMALLMLLAGLNFYKILAPLRLMPDKVLYVLIFLSPSLLFWTGGIYKEGMVYLGLSCCMLAIIRLATGKRMFRFSLLLILGLCLIALFRNYLLLLLLPALMLLFYTLKYPKKAGWKFLGIYGLGLLSLIALMPFSPVNLYEVLAQRQWAFLAEWGGSDFNVVPLEPHLASFVGFLPTAILNVLFRPFLWDADTTVQLLSGLGIALFWVLMLVFLFLKKKKTAWHPIQWFFLFYAITNLLLVGFLVSNAGTITRYRVVAIHFLILLVVSLIDFETLSKD